ncbi:conserved hypothetical protein [Agrobacterium tumefaciens str. CFBP 5621]|uniref:hypothetical protein n=1 Tax=Agrobacterium tumefaciens TaxID=358 RepID=UPI0009BB6529|nr:hypothetical protein [Agrobacterium tumefaciens]CUX50723.1 conserved hypothetical protein [Agrobacterium tumefaciens str. CFBP 5621]
MIENEILSPALVALLQIMTSADVSEARCIEAAKAIIEYEAPQGVYDLTHRYLLGVAEDEAQDVGLKLEALKLIRKVEARWVVPGVAVATDVATSREAGRRLGAAKRRLAIIADGKWPPTEGWERDVESEAVMLNFDGLAERLEVVRFV